MDIFDFLLLLFVCLALSLLTAHWYLKVSGNCMMSLTNSLPYGGMTPEPKLFYRQNCNDYEPE